METDRAKGKSFITKAWNVVNAKRVTYKSVGNIKNIKLYIEQ